MVAVVIKIFLEFFERDDDKNSFLIFNFTIFVCYSDPLKAEIAKETSGLCECEISNQNLAVQTWKDRCTVRDDNFLKMFTRIFNRLVLFSTNPINTFLRYRIRE